MGLLRCLCGKGEKNGIVEKKELSEGGSEGNWSTFKRSGKSQGINSGNKRPEGVREGPYVF